MKYLLFIQTYFSDQADWMDATESYTTWLKYTTLILCRQLQAISSRDNPPLCTTWGELFDCFTIRESHENLNGLKTDHWYMLYVYVVKLTRTSG